MSRSAQNGFTFIEVLVVATAMAILMAIAFPMFMKWRPNLELKSTAKDMFSDIQNAKLEAAKRSSCVGIRFTTVSFPATGGQYELFVDNGDGAGVACNGMQDGSEQTLRTEMIDSPTTLLSASNMGGPSTLCFSPTTVVCGSQAGQIHMRNASSRWYRILISAAGGARIEMSSDGTNWSN